jgi:hypothetical protein
MSQPHRRRLAGYLDVTSGVVLLGIFHACFLPCYRFWAVSLIVVVDLPVWREQAIAASVA